MEIDPFYKQLANKQRNLTKKLKRITDKQKQKDRALAPEELELIGGKQQVEDALTETSRLLEQYQKYSQNPPKKQEKIEENKKADVLDLWLVGEFLRNPESLRLFKQEHPDDAEVDLFLAFYSTVRGETGQTFSMILSNMQNSMSLYLSKSEKVVPGIMRTYKNISEFTSNALLWCMKQTHPIVPSRPQLAINATDAHSLQIPENTEEVKAEETTEPTYVTPTSPLPEQKESSPDKQIDDSEPLEEEVEAKETVKELPSPKKEKPTLYQKPISSWAEQEDDWLSPLHDETKEEGFTEVIKKRKKKPDEGFEKVDSKKNIRRGRRPHR